jgi:hypothetical protein
MEGTDVYSIIGEAGFTRLVAVQARLGEDILFQVIPNLGL